jgi:hypothetical protein
LLMSAFHVTPWLRLFSRRRTGPAERDLEMAGRIASAIQPDGRKSNGAMQTLLIARGQCAESLPDRELSARDR